MPSPSALYKECNEAILAHTFNIQTQYLTFLNTKAM